MAFKLIEIPSMLIPPGFPPLPYPRPDGIVTYEQLTAYATLVAAEREAWVNKVLQAQFKEKIAELHAALAPFANEFKDWDGIGVPEDWTYLQMIHEVPLDSDDDCAIKFTDLQRAAQLLAKERL